MGKIVSINISENKGTAKTPVIKGVLKEEYGLIGDAHSGNWHRQVSLLDIESIRKVQESGVKINMGDFAENITTEGINLENVKIGDIIKAGSAVLEVTQIGKECHDMCEIRKKVGDCIMPKKGVFTRVIKGGEISAGESIKYLYPINVGILTLSDKGSKGEREDLSGQMIKDIVKKINGQVLKYEILPDEFEEIKSKLTNWCEPNQKIDIILTTGGTGFSLRDITPEATQSVIQRLAPGLSEAMRFEGYKNNSKAILSRGISGIRNNTLIVNLPGSVRGVRESLEVLLDVVTHGIEILKGRDSECGQVN